MFEILEHLPYFFTILQTNMSALNERRSLREKKNKRSFSPDLEMKKKRKKSTRTQSYTSSSRPCDLLPDGILV